MRNLLLFLHVVGAILLIGPTTLATSRFARHVVEGDVAGASQAARTSRIYGTASVVVPVLGVALALRIDAFAQLWVQLSLGLFVVGAVLLLGVHLPAQRHAVTELDAGEAVSSTLLMQLRASAGSYALTWVVIVWLMVAKPG